jgi:hypothetical protein
MKASIGARRTPDNVSRNGLEGAARCLRGSPCPGLNDALDRFVAEGLKRGLPLTLVNHPSGPHAFDLFDDSEMSRQAVAQAIDFLRIRIGRS